MYEGSDYTLPCNSEVVGNVPTSCGYSSDYPPFGSIVPPANSLNSLVNPYEWDSKSSEPGNQPLYYEEPEGDPGQARAGQIYTEDNLKRLFARSYGVWQWNGSHYVKSGAGWTAPKNLCGTDGLPPRPAYPNDLCGIKPLLYNIKVNGSSSDLNINDNQFVNLTFNSDVDSNQMPLTMYAVDWGDNEHSIVSGVEMNDKPNEENPHSFYHLYSYWDLKSMHAVDQNFSGMTNDIYCGEAGNDAVNFNGIDSGLDCIAKDCCVVQPKAKIKDGWGFCNNALNGMPCPEGGYELFGGWIIIKSSY
jgi:hypothetical protein